MMTPDESVMDTIAWSESAMQECRVAAPPIHFPIEKAGIWADAVRTRRPKIVNDYSLPDKYKKGLPEGHIAITRLLSLPIVINRKVVMVAAVANKQQDYDNGDVIRLTLLMEGVWSNLQKRRAEEALIESEYRFRALFDSMSSGVAVYRTVDNGDDFEFVDFNHGAEIIENVNKEEVIGKRVSEAFPGVVEFGLMEVFKRVWRTGEPEHYPVSLYRNQHISSWRETYVYRLPSMEIVAVYDDVTKSKEAEDALIESEYRFRALFDSMSSGVTVYRAVDNGDDFEYVDFNHGAEIIENVNKQEVIGKRVSEVFPGAGELGLMEVFNRVWRTGEPEHYPLSMYRNQRISSWHEVYVYRLPSMEIVAVYDDVTKSKETEEALRQNENLFRTLFEQSPISLWEEDFSNVKNWIEEKKREGISDLGIYLRDHPEDFRGCASMVKVIHINHATMVLFGAASSREFSEGMSVIFSAGSLDSLCEEIVALSRGDKVFEKEISLYTLQGEKKTVIMKVMVMPGYEQTLSRIFVSVIDITQRKNMEEALREANNKLNMLSSITRHDILNMIMIIRGYLELSKNMVDDPKLREYMKIENKAIDTIQRQIEFTRYYQDVGVEEPKWQDAGEIVDKVAEQLDLRGITLDNSLKGVEIFADPLIEKVFYNLIDNSIRHGEHVTSIDFSYSEKDDETVISYRDNGVGISEEDKNNLFLRGFGKHTGLGLFLSREILSITGITIQETGEPGKGVNFEIVMPKGGYRNTA